MESVDAALLFIPYSQTNKRCRGEGSVIGEVFASLSVIPPFTDFAKGLIDLRYLFYFVSIIALCLFITNTVLQSKRA